jgi:hypothetical protein
MAIQLIVEKSVTCNRIFLRKCARWSDLLTLTMWTPDGDERHETLLASGRYQDQVQCAINRSPSLHREHYPRSAISTLRPSRDPGSRCGHRTAHPSVAQAAIRGHVKGADTAVGQTLPRASSSKHRPSNRAQRPLFHDAYHPLNGPMRSLRLTAGAEPPGVRRGKHSVDPASGFEPDVLKRG